MRRIFTVCAIASLLLAASFRDALAQSAPTTTASTGADHFSEGRLLFARGEVATACRMFEQSYGEDAAPGTLYNMALCHEKEGRLGDAYRELQLLARRAEGVGRAGQAVSVRDRARSFERRLARVELLAPSVQPLQVASVSLDGVPLLPEDWKRPLHVDPGVHRFRVRYADGTAREKITGVLSAGSVTTLDFDVASVIVARPSSARRTVAYVTGAAGIALVATGAVLGTLAFVERHDADSACPTSPCPSAQGYHDAYQDRHDGKVDATLSTVGLAVGGAALATGLVLFFTGRRDDATATAPTVASSWKIAPAGYAGGAGLHLGTSF